MRRLSWIAAMLGVFVLAGCGETTPTKKQTLTATATSEQSTRLTYSPHPWTDAISVWHRPDLTTTELKGYKGFMLEPVVMAPEGQMSNPRVQAVKADIIQTRFPAMMASAMHPRYELMWEKGDRQMKMQVVLLAAAKKPQPGDVLRYLPVTLDLNAQDKTGKPLVKRITVAAAGLRIDLMDAQTNAPLLSILDTLEEVKAAWRQEPGAPLIDLEQLVRHWAVKVRFNLDSLQEPENQPLGSAS